MRTIKRIVIHCTATQPTTTVEQIKRYWKNVLGWRSPGYHYIIGRNGERHILSNIRSITNGVRGFNRDSIHIAYIGGKTGDDRTPKQKEEMKRIIQELRLRLRSPNLPVVGHRDLSPDRNKDGKVTSNEWLKLCPNFEVRKWLDCVGL